MGGRPQLLIIGWIILTWPVHIVLSFIHMWMASRGGNNWLWGLHSLLDFAQTGLVFWFAMYRPHSRITIAVCMALLVLPTGLGVLYTASFQSAPQEISLGPNIQTNLLSLQIAGLCSAVLEAACAGCLLAMFSLVSGLQLNRQGEAAQEQELRVSWLLIITSIIAAAFGLAQLAPSETDLLGEKLGQPLSALNGLHLGLVWILISWAWWKRSAVWMGTAFAASMLTTIALRMTYVLILSVLVDPSTSLDHGTVFTIVSVAFSGSLGALTALAFIHFAGYRMGRAARRDVQDIAAEQPPEFGLQ